MQKRIYFFIIIAFFLSYGSLWGQALMGFSSGSSEKQKDLEKQFDQLIQIQNYDDWMKYMSAKPHHVGSPHGKEIAEFMVGQFQSWGFDAQLEEYQVLFPTPKVRLLEMSAPQTYKASLAEPPVEGDPSSRQSKDALPPYNCFSIDGDVEAELVFVNYGVPADYEELEKRGIDVRGKIVIAKYYGSWRGIKPKVAAEKGAIGCIIYSDPKDDGYFQGDVYPEGAFKNEDGVQRGSVLDMPLYPGDPLTPGYGATGDARRIDQKEAPTLTQIPVLPISYKDAQPLLAALKGEVAPDSWKGALPITYHIGPGPAKVHLKLEFDWQLQPAYNVIAKMEGSTYPEQWVIRGNHHDAWVHGANDPISGMVALMEEARVVGELVKTGWRPKRTLVYCGWDAEEPGLLGSTEWVEHHASELQKKAVIYINTDGSGRGFLYAGGSHSLAPFFDRISKEVQDPLTEVSLFKRRRALEQVQGKAHFSQFPLSALGSGSDYTPFMQHLGIPALNIAMRGENAGGEYHTMYDSYVHYKRFKNPGFTYLKTLTEVCGRTTLRFAEADVLPFRFNALANTIAQYLQDIVQMTDTMREEAEKENKMIQEGLYRLAADPKKPFVEPKPKMEVPYINFAPLQNAMVQLAKQAHKLDKYLSEGDWSASQKEELNLQLYQMEKALLHPGGLPGRPWFKHHLYAPGFYTGYGVKTLPGVREAIEQKDFELAQEQIDRLSRLLARYAFQMREMMAN